MAKIQQLSATTVNIKLCLFTIFLLNSSRKKFGHIFKTSFHVHYNYVLEVCIDHVFSTFHYHHRPENGILSRDLCNFRYSSH